NFLKDLSIDEALQFFEDRDITAGAVCDIADLMVHPYVLEREMLVEQTTPDGRKVMVHAAPYHINGVRPPIRRQAPALGEDDAYWFGSESGQVDTPAQG